MSGIGINTGFEIAKKGLRSQLAGLNVTGHNISNVATEGYSRQELNLKPSVPFKLTYGVFGTGVEADGVRRIRDTLIDRQLREQTTDVNKYQTYERVLREIETIINEPSEHGIRSLVSEFFDNFHELANDPESMTTRNYIREQARVLTNAMNRVDDQLMILSQSITFEISTRITDVNSILGQISKLNGQIKSLENIGKSANDSRDQRDKLIDDLSEYMDIYVKEHPSGDMNIASGGRGIVFGARNLEFGVEESSEDGEIVAEIVAAEDLRPVTIRNGQLYALQRMKNEIIPKYRESLDTVAEELISKVNNLHSVGVGLKGTSLVIPTNIDFFQGTDAGTIALSDDIEDNLNNIAAAQRVETTDASGNVEYSGSPGDNTIALQIAGLKTSLVLNNGTQSILDLLNATIGELGVETSDAARIASNNNLLLNELKNIKDSTSGVSLDEEFVNLIKFQRGYQASARVISVIDEMFETLITM